MKTITPKRQKSITLRQYMYTSSLKKRVSSRASSRQKRQSTITSDNGQMLPSSFISSERDKLVEEIKLTLAKTIQNQNMLGQILKMFSRIIQLYNQEILERHCQSDLLATMLQQGAVKKITQTKRTQETNYKQSVPESIKNSSINVPESQSKSRKNSVQIHHHYRNSSNTSSEEIPNINVLLMTGNGSLFEKKRDQQTADTLLEHSFRKPYEEQSKISIQINHQNDEQRSFINNSRISATPFNRLLQSNSKDLASSNTSISSSLWKRNNDQNSFLSKFQELKRRKGK